MIESKTINTDKKPASFKFTFEEPVAMLTVLAFEAGNPENRFYRRFLKHATDEMEIRFPVTPQALQIVFQTENPFGIKSYLKYDCQPRSFEHTFEPEVKRAFGITDLKFVWVDDLGGTPAKIRIEGPEAATIFLCRASRAKYTQQIWAFIVLHEIAHVFFNTESKADEWAFYQYMLQGYNASVAVFALTDVLKCGRVNVERMAKMFYLTYGFNEKYN